MFLDSEVRSLAFAPPGAQSPPVIGGGPILNLPGRVKGPVSVLSWGLVCNCSSPWHRWCHIMPTYIGNVLTVHSGGVPAKKYELIVRLSASRLGTHWTHSLGTWPRLDSNYLIICMWYGCCMSEVRLSSPILTTFWGNLANDLLDLRVSPGHRNAWLPVDRGLARPDPWWSRRP